MIYLYLLCITIATIFIDLPLADKIGTIGKSIMIFVSPIIVVFSYFLSEKARILLDRIDVKIFFGYWFITLVSSILILNVYTYTTGQVYSIYGHNMLGKLIKASSYNLIFAMAYFSYAYILGNLSYRKLSYFFSFVFLFLSIVGLVEIFNKDALNIFHNLSVEYDRLRLLTSEPSQAGLLYIIFLLIAVFFIKRNYLKLIFLLWGLLLFYFISSKGAYLNLMLAMIIAYFIGTSFRQKFKMFFFLIPFLFIMVYFFVPVLVSRLENDIQYFSSFATRFTGLISALIVLIYYPFGTGYGTYMDFYPEIVGKAMYFLQNSLKWDLNFSELEEIIETGKNIGLKSGVLFQILFNGWFAVLFFSLVFFSTYRKINLINAGATQKFILKVLIFFVLFEILTTTDIEVMYAYLIPIALINNFYYDQVKRYKEY